MPEEEQPVRQMNRLSLAQHKTIKKHVQKQKSSKATNENKELAIKLDVSAINVSQTEIPLATSTNDLHDNIVLPGELTEGRRL